MWLAALVVWAVSIGAAQVTAGAAAQTSQAATLLVPPGALVAVVLAGGYDQGQALGARGPEDEE